MMEKVEAKEWRQLIRSVFPELKDDKNLTILVDVPDETVQDHPGWRARREMAVSWKEEINKVRHDLGLEKIALVLYPNVHSNNADLPDTGYFFEGDPVAANDAMLRNEGKAAPMDKILSDYTIILAPTEFSATAPLKMLGSRFGFRAATMPGFSQKMIPALRLDYNEVNRRVDTLKELLDPAKAADVEFLVKGRERYHLHLDLRYRTAHASGGRLPKPGMAGNLPSGETYIVPYEGEKETASLSKGLLPVQFEDEVVLYRIEKNRAIEVLSTGSHSAAEAEKLKAEPAYSNIAELGLGILRDFGVKPAGEILLDEKLGLHIAFGRSDHFGGTVGPGDFTAPEKVVHIDRIYIPETQPHVRGMLVRLHYPGKSEKIVIRDEKYTIF